MLPGVLLFINQDDSGGNPATYYRLRIRSETHARWPTKKFLRLPNSSPVHNSENKPRFELWVHTCMHSIRTIWPLCNLSCVVRLTQARLYRYPKGVLPLSLGGATGPRRRLRWAHHDDLNILALVNYRPSFRNLILRRFIVFMVGMGT